MVNCNPETVSTDYDTSDRLYFEPLDDEAVLAVLEREQPVGVVHPVRRPDAAEARARDRATPASRILGTPFDAIDLAEDRERFGGSPRRLGVRCPEWGIAETADEAIDDRRADRLPGARPPFVRARRPRRCASATRPTRSRTRCSRRQHGRLLVDRFLENAVEIDVDALCDGTDTYVAAVMRARRGGRRPLRRLVLRPAGALARRRRVRRDPPRRPAARRRRSASSASSTSSSRSPAARSTCSR